MPTATKPVTELAEEWNESEVMSIPLYQPYAYVAMQKRISGYRYWFHRQMDYRTLVKV